MDEEINLLICKKNLMKMIFNEYCKILDEYTNTINKSCNNHLDLRYRNHYSQMCSYAQTKIQIDFLIKYLHVLYDNVNFDIDIHNELQQTINIFNNGMVLVKQIKSFIEYTNDTNNIMFIEYLTKFYEK